MNGRNTDEKTRFYPSIRLFVSLSVVSVSGVHPRDEPQCFIHRNLRGGGKKWRG